MAKEHAISWLNIPGYIPETWNPLIGCSKVSEGCLHCYAERMAARLSYMPNVPPYINTINASGQWNGETVLVKKAFDKPFRWKQPRAIFVGSMSDLFHENTPDEWITDVFSVIIDNPRHIFILVTKRPERLYKYLELDKDGWMVYMPPNVWLIVTTENQKQADIRIPVLLQIPAKVRGISCEPLLGPINLESYWLCRNGNRYPFPMLLEENRTKYIDLLDWVLVGGESGPGHRVMYPSWVSEIRDQCRDAGAPFFFKQWHKKSDGRLLDGQEYNEFPKILSHGK